MREWIAARENVPVERVLVTNGGFHGLSLAIQTVLERGDLVAVDNPIFPLFLRGLELSDARILPDPRRAVRAWTSTSSPTGCGTAPVRPRCTRVPDFHNPSQSTLPTEQRRELVALAERYGFIVLRRQPVPRAAVPRRPGMRSSRSTSRIT